METFDFKSIGLRELSKSEAAIIDGGIIPPATSVWWSAFVNYIQYSMETGGANVTHHAQ